MLIGISSNIYLGGNMQAWVNKQRRSQQGFTLIEVMIVLAIAGLILLVVFLAVPALQRNARNTTRREDAGNLLSAVSEYIANNNGAIPVAQTNLGASGPTATLGASGVNTIPISLGSYTANNVSVVAWSTGATNTTTVDTAVIMTGASCAGSGAPASGSAKSTIIMFTLEANAKQCRQS